MSTVEQGLEQRLERLERELRDLKCQHAIRTMLSQYAIGVDDKRPDILRSLFTADARLQIPEWQIDVSGTTDIMAFYDYYWDRFDNPRRYYANEDIRVSGHSASAFMYWHVTQEREGRSYLGWGTYDWDLRELDGAWRIAAVIIRLRAMTTLAAGWAGTNKFSDAG